MAGNLEVITGPMFSGKTEKLIDAIRVARNLGRSVQVYKPKIDGRYSATEVVSHRGTRVDASPIEVSALADARADNVAIDEVQFFGDAVIGPIMTLVRRGVRVVVSGLDLTYKGEPFGPMPVLLSLADSVVKLHGTCAVCGGESSRTQRRVKSDDAILVGGSESYEPRCFTCFDPL